MASRCSAASGTKYSRTSPPSAKNRRRSAVSGEPGAGAGAGAMMKGAGIGSAGGPASGRGALTVAEKNVG